MFSTWKNPLILLSGTSIILSVTLWPILCYNFVLNCMQLTMTTLTLSKTSSSSSMKIMDDDADEIDLSEIALIFTMNSALIIIEGILVVCLVIQFMSSFDYLTGNGQEYKENWMKCHRKVLLLNSIVLIIKFSVSFFFLNYYASIFNESLLELYAMTVNFIFLVIAVNVSVLMSNHEPATSSSSSQIQSGNENGDIHQIINVHSFLDNDRPPPYSIEKIPAIQPPPTNNL